MTTRTFAFFCKTCGRRPIAATARLTALDMARLAEHARGACGVTPVALSPSDGAVLSRFMAYDVQPGNSLPHALPMRLGALPATLLDAATLGGSEL